ncbi:hypothetical protein HanIR_Chr06g0288811 [Helianthus annuus]|nr:hypothetical protein HanIR_Chr06g0288811 [Helianthus annuus]
MVTRSDSLSCSNNPVGQLSGRTVVRSDDYSSGLFLPLRKMSFENIEVSLPFRSVDRTVLRSESNPSG